MYNFLNHFNLTPTNSYCFASFISALRALISTQNITCLWLPAFSCNLLADSIIGRCQFKFYPMQPNLSPDLHFLANNLISGEAVMAINYFGKLPDDQFVAFTKTRPDIRWIEDRSQSLLAPPLIWGDYVLYNPGQILPGTTGGILYSLKTLGSFDNEQCIDSLSYKILEETDMAFLINRCRDNYQLLNQELGGIALFPAIAEDFAACGFAVTVKNKDLFLKSVNKKRALARSPFYHLPVSKVAFPVEHEILSHIVIIDCGIQYGLGDIKLIIASVKHALLTQCPVEIF